MNVTTRTIGLNSELGAGGDLAAQVAFLQVESGEQTRDIERRIQQTEESIAENDADQEVDAMRQKAHDTFTQGMVDGVSSMGEGAFQAASASCTFRSAGCEGAAGTALKAQGAWYSSGGVGLQGSSKIFDAFEGGAQLTDDVVAKTRGQAADRASRAAQDAHDAAAREQDAVAQATTFFEDVQQLRVSTNAAILQRA